MRKQEKLQIACDSTVRSFSQHWRNKVGKVALRRRPRTRWLASGMNKTNILSLITLRAGNCV
jgi:hypothetical protein